MSQSEINAILLSIQVAAVAVLVSAPAGIYVGYVLARKTFFGKTILETLINLPLVVPPVVTGYLLLVMFGRNGPVGGLLDDWLGIQIVFDWKGAALAAAVVAFPLMVRSIRTAFAAVDPRLEECARSLGAGPLDTFRSVSLPLARHGVIAGCVLAFARSLGEFGATIMIAGNIAGHTQTIPLYIYDQLQTENGFAQSTTIILISILISAAALLVSSRLEQKDLQHLA